MAARAGRRFLLKPGRPIVRKITSQGISTTSDVVFIATSTLTVEALLYIPALSILEATSTLTGSTSVSSTSLSALTATSTLTVNAIVSSTASSVLTAMSTLTANALVSSTISSALTSTSTLTFNTAVVSVLASSDLTSTSTLTGNAIVSYITTGIAPVNVKSTDNNIAIKSIMDLKNKALWLRAKDLGANGSAVTSWPDRSGTNHNGVAVGTGLTVADNATSLGGKAVKFVGTGNLDFGQVFSADTFVVPVATASSYYGGEEPIRAIDNTSSSWTTSGVGLPHWWQIVFSSAKTITTYSIKSRDDILSRNPMDWTIQGSNNGFTTYDTLDTQIGVTWPTPETKAYSFINTVSYLAYRIYITANNGDGYTSINNIVFGEVVLDDIQMTPNGHEVWIVVKAEQNSNVPNGLWKWSDSAYYNAYPDSAQSSGYVYESFCTDTYTYFYYTPPEQINNKWNVYRVVQNELNLKLYLNGVLKSNTTVGTLGFTSNVSIGKGIFQGTFRYFKGKIAEVLARNTVSTSTEAADILAYFKDEHIVPKTSGLAPVMEKTQYNVGVVPEASGYAPETAESSSSDIFASTTNSTAPMDGFSSSLFIAELSGYPGEPNQISIPFELTGIMDPEFPPPVPPVDFDGLADPTVAPTLTKSDTSGGNLIAGTYRYSYAAWKGSPVQATAPSPTADIILAAEDTVTLTYPTIAGADGYLVYREDL